jgi:CheY-like chemotaxis protein
VELAADAAGAAALFAGRRRDALIADRALGPDIDRLASAARAGGCRTVALATPAERRDLDSLRAAGFDHFLVKPVRIASLLGVLGAPARLAAPPPLPAATASRAGRALLAEDDPVSALFARAQLERHGFVVEHVSDGAAAVAATARALDEGLRFDLVLLDLRLPGLDGTGAARQIRVLEAARGAPRTAMLALTAHAGLAERAAAAAAGIDAVLDKPLDRADLSAALAPRAAVG